MVYPMDNPNPGRTLCLFGLIKHVAPDGEEKRVKSKERSANYARTSRRCLFFSSLFTLLSSRLSLPVDLIKHPIIAEIHPLCLLPSAERLVNGEHRHRRERLLVLCQHLGVPGPICLLY